ncbi:nucleocytoplasmic shuttling protein for mRNA cap-binding EIF4E domain-containing protein [Phthorimaea operculella]|nr:nucleocytoplasmic shuttling protein for mRNA cap-binding EIF4E domain-containing protein [Phthorimaea operculella]
MSAVSLLSSLREKPSEESPRDGSIHEGYEEEEAPGGGGVSGGGGDPAVLCVGPARRPLTYTIEEMLKLRNSPLVKKNLETAFVGCEALALVLKRRSDSPNEEDRGARGDAPSENHKGVYARGERTERDRERRSADPRERVRKESEPSGGGIVLSPQRRSFVSGCGAPVATVHPPPPIARTRPESPLPNAPNTKPDQGRRIGSGRIMVRDTAGTGWEEGEWNNSTSTAEPYRPPRERERANNDRFERRSYGRDNFSSDIKREREERFNNEKGGRDREDNNRRQSGRNNYRRYNNDEEPEWFSEGPSSRLETIELRGFDEPGKKNGTANTKETEKWNNNNNNGSRSPECWRSEAASSPSQNNANDSNNTDTTNNDKDSGVESKPEEQPQNNEQADFNLDEFLKFDSIPDVLTNGSGEAEGGSRFSRWFRRDSPTTDAKHYERLLHNIVDDLDNSAPPPNPAAGEAGHVFAPISPCAAPPPSLLELLRRANANAEPRPGNYHPSHPGHPPHTQEEYPPKMNSVGGKIHSLEELEARLRPQPAQHNAPDHDLSAFKRLLAQVSGGHAVPADTHPPQQPPQQPQPPMSLLQTADTHPPQQPPQQPQPPMSLLQLAQVSGGHAVPADTHPPQQPPQQPQPPMSLLQLAQVSGGHAVPADTHPPQQPPQQPQPPMSLLQLAQVSGGHAVPADTHPPQQPPQQPQPPMSLLQVSHLTSHVGCSNTRSWRKCRAVTRCQLTPTHRSSRRNSRNHP